MKAIVCVNCQIPTVKAEIEYDSDTSLLDYDIVVFDPALPYYDRIQFDAGGSCISIDGTKRVLKSQSHWTRELANALRAGKTVFVALSPHRSDSGAVGSTSTKTSRSYQTTAIDNYSVIPGRIAPRNATGRSISVKDSTFKPLYEIIKGISEYRVVLDNIKLTNVVFTAKDGTAVGGVIRYDEFLGCLVLLPNFDFEADEYTEEDQNSEAIWSAKALQTSNALVRQLVEIDRVLRSAGELTPAPNWVDSFDKAQAVKAADSMIVDIDRKIDELQATRSENILKREEILEYSHLLYETGKPLEKAIEKSLILLGYSVETFHSGDLEIDHVIVGPSGIRMIGESEGKDASAIDISKFRQLESNIGEDFQRDDVSDPAKGLLFGNGFRLSAPEDRAEQFTEKSLKNASRLGSALIRTADLYPVAIHLLDFPEDDTYKAACRDAIEQTVGGIVTFPKTPSREPSPAPME